jgi:hypothetical protein
VDKKLSRQDQQQIKIWSRHTLVTPVLRRLNHKQIPGQPELYSKTLSQKNKKKKKDYNPSYSRS